ncbi:hypothetical protein, partial [Pantoea septica]|uniref:hypothetical protein n=1 Tax=Pantoea septica TaxID=472695 RepID=UPI00289965C0
LCVYSLFSLPDQYLLCGASLYSLRNTGFTVHLAEEARILLRCALAIPRVGFASFVAPGLFFTPA